MKKDRFSESKMVKTVKRLEGGESPMALCKEIGISKTSSNTLCNAWDN